MLPFQSVIFIESPCGCFFASLIFQLSFLKSDSGFLLLKLVRIELEGVFFSEHLSQSQLSSVAYSSLCRAETSWPFPLHLIM